MKYKKSIIEEVFTHPSFNLRFWLSVLAFVLAFGTIAKYALDFAITREDVYQIINLVLQAAMLVAGIVAAYFALRQLTESRYLSLNDSALAALRRKPPEYFKAIKMWKEALYIKAEPNTFLNLMETLVLSEQFSDFDEYLSYVQKNRSFARRVLQEPCDYMIFYYISAVRQLLVKNMGEAELQTKKIIEITKKENINQRISWEFADFLTSNANTNKLNGDHKIMAGNIIKYLNRELSLEDVAKFESGNYLLTN